MNVLLTAAGRRVSLLRAWQAAVHPGGQVFAADVDALAPAVLLADGAAALPRLSDPAYAGALLATVQRLDVQLLVPTIDTELPVLAELRDPLAQLGCRALVSSPAFVALCHDKWHFGRAFSAWGLSTPRSWLPADLAAPPPDLPGRLFVKPRDGSASLHAQPLGAGEIAAVVPRVPNAIIQEQLEGREITIDALLDFAGQPLHYVPRQRLRTVGGESIQGVTIDDDGGLGAWITRVLEVAGELGAQGPLTVQAFLTARGPVLTEINPRFGGGYPLGHAAGGHYPQWLLALARGETLRPRLGEYTRQLSMTRHYTETFVTRPAW